MKSQLLAVLKKLSPRENKQLELLSQSSCLCKNKSSLLLFKELQRYYPGYEIGKKEKIQIFGNIYGNVKYSDSTFRSLVHSLMHSLEDFMIIQNLSKGGVARDVLFLKTMQDKNLNCVLEKRLSKIKQEDKFSPEQLIDNYRLEVLKFNFKKINKSNIHKSFIESQYKSIESSHLILALYFLIEVISDYVNKQIICRKYSFKPIGSPDMLDALDIEKLKSIFRGSKFEKIFNLYYALHWLFKDFENEQNYYRYKTGIEQTACLLDRFELSQHYSVLISYSILKKNSSKGGEFKNELWSLYEHFLENDFYSDAQNPYLDIYLFRSILFLGLSLGSYDKVKVFIDNFSSKVHPTETQNVRCLAYSYYFYEVKEVEKALEYAKKITLSDFVFKYDVKNLLVKIYYELGYHDSLASIIHTYREFLRNDKMLNTELKKSFRVFLNYVENLTRCSFKNNNIEIKYHYELLKNDKIVYSKDWLLKNYMLFLQKVNAGFSGEK